jgi:hypothetical protein
MSTPPARCLFTLWRQNQKDSNDDVCAASNSIIPCRSNFVRNNGTSINSPSSTASAQAEEEDRHQHIQSARLAQVRKRPNYQKKVPQKKRGAGDAKAENLSQGAKKSGICAGKELPNKLFSDYLHLHYS